MGLIFDWFLEGKSYSEIIKGLEERGFKPRFSSRFSHSTIHAILTNKRNCGISVWNSKEKRKQRKRVVKEVFDEVVSEDVVPDPIIDKEKFNRVQEILERRPRTKVQKKGLRYPLSGLLVCGDCGGAITGTSMRSGRNKTLYQGYECKNPKPKHGGHCSTKMVRTQYLEGYLKKALHALIQAHYTKHGVDEDTRKAYFQHEDHTTKRLKREKTDHDNLLSKLTEGLYTTSSAAVKKQTEKKIEKVDGLVQTTQKRLDELTDKREVVSDKLERLTQGTIAIDELFPNKEITRRLFQAFIDKVVIANGDIEIHFKEVSD